MSKVNELIREKCPNGVEYKNVKELCLENFWVMPSTPKFQTEGVPYITSKNIRNGDVMFDDVKYITYSDFKDISNNRPIKEADFLISMIGTIGEVGIVKQEDLPFYGQNMYLLRLNTRLINIKYFYHYFTSDIVRKVLLGEKNNGNQGYLRTKNIESLKVPVPPLEVQEEIVRVLDKFCNLEAMLEMELDARKSQFEFWSRFLFDNVNGEKIKLGDLLDYIQPTKYIVNSTEYSDEYSIPVLTAGQTFILGYTNEINNIYNASKDSPVIIFDDFTTSNHWVDFEFKVKSSAMKILVPKTENNFKYIYYAIKNIKYEAKEHARQWIQNYSNFEIKVPSIDIQNNIVKILDKFDFLINDMSVGIPAEIKLRRQQYEYYRNQLLNFEELKYEE